MALLTLLLSGCAGWWTAHEAPEVLVTNITPMNGSAFEQRLQLDIRIRNPNDHDLEVTGMDIRVDLNGQRLARGLSNQAVTVPRLGEALVSIETSTSMLDILRQIVGLRHAEELAYGISGRLFLAAGSVPFENRGVLLDQDTLAGARRPAEPSHR